MQHCAVRCWSRVRRRTRARARSSPASAAGWCARACRWRRSRRRTCRNNSVVTADGGEIGRAQAMQAHACGLAPSVAFNPVLLKPGSDRSAQVVVRGRVARHGQRAVVPASARRALLDVVTASLADLRSRFDVVVCEGAGSPAEINLRAHRHRQHGAGAGRRPAGGGGRRHRPRRGARAPVRHGRRAVDPADQARIAGFVVNKFRGDPALLAPGLDQLPRADRPPDARGGAVGGRGCGSTPRTRSPRSPTGCSAGRRRRTARSGCGWRWCGSRGSPTRPTPRRWRASRASRCATSPSRRGSRTPTSSCCPGSQRDRRGPRVAAPHRAGRRGASRTRRPGGRCWGSAAATRCSGGGSRTRTGSRAATAEGLGLLDLEIEFAAEKLLAEPGRDGLGPAGARLRDPPRARGAVRRSGAARRAGGLRRGRRPRHPLARAAGERRVPPRAAARVAEQAGRTGFRAAPGHVVRRGAGRAARPARRPRRAAPRHRRAADMSSVTARRRTCPTVTSGLAGSCSDLLSAACRTGRQRRRPVPVLRRRRPRRSASRAAAQRRAPRRRRGAGAGGEGHGEVDGGARAGRAAAGPDRGAGLPVLLRPGRPGSALPRRAARARTGVRRRRPGRRRGPRRDGLALLATPPSVRHVRAARLVELPVGATEDRLVGSLDLERALAEGVRAYQPGLLAEAHRGVLYVDEVNLLHDHLVDAPAGRRRDGPGARRAGRGVGVARRVVPAGRDDEPGGGRAAAAAARPVRAHRRGPGVARRRRPASRSCAGGWRSSRIRRRSPRRSPRPRRRRRAGSPTRGPGSASVVLPDAELRRIAAVCASFDVDGMRADLVIARAATAHAAWRGADAVAKEDVRAAARLALPHRRRRDPFDEPGMDEQALDEALDGADEEPDPDRTRRRPRRSRRRRAGARRATPTPRRSRTRRWASQTCPNAAFARRRRTARARPADGPGQRRAARRRTGFRARRLVVPGVGEGAPGRRSRARTDSGRIVRPTHGTPRRAVELHLPATVAAAAPHQRDPRPGRRGARRRARRPAPRRAGGARGQPRAVRRRRLGVDGGPAPDGRGLRRRAVAAARRLPAPRQGRAPDLPRHGCRGRAAADVQRPRRAGPARRRCARAAAPRWPTACCARGGCWPSSGCATPAVAPCSWC